MAGKRPQRLGLARALTGLLTVTPVLRCEHQPAAIDVVVAVRPSIVGSPIYPHQDLAGVFGAFFDGEELRPAVVQLVAAVHGGIQGAIQWIVRERNGVSQARRVPPSIARPLAQAVCVELPDSGARVELSAR